MNTNIQLLDCTLRDGAYIVNGNFGVPAIRGIIKRMQEAYVDIIECGWLKNESHELGKTFYHVPDDLKQYMPEKQPYTTYVVMIDWDRYNLDNLPICDGKTIDAIRIVFPREHFREGIAVGKSIREKGYKVFFQAANTLAYSEEELNELAIEINTFKPQGLSIVDTFGAMYGEDLTRILSILNERLDPNIVLGFHSHNNQQLSFALSMQFADMMHEAGRKIIIDASLCGMGRGAGNATTELVANFLNRKYRGNYDMNTIMDAIDMYMGYFQDHYQWGYSTPYFIAGMYCTHVNNIAYLLHNRRTKARDMRNIIESLAVEDRRKYDYSLLEKTYLDYQNKVVDDTDAIEFLSREFKGRFILLLLPGKSVLEQRQHILDFIEKKNPILVGINAVFEEYKYDYLFFNNSVRYEYAQEVYSSIFHENKRIVASNIKTATQDDELLVNFNLLVKRGWEHFDNSGIMCLRLLNRLHVSKVALAGFDGFEDVYSESYADVSLPRINPGKKWNELNAEIKDMFDDFCRSTDGKMQIEFITPSKYQGTRR